MSIVNYEIAEKVLDGIISVHGTRRNLDASTDERRCVIVTPADLETYAKEFKYNVGKVSDGKNVFFPEPTIYTRIPVNIHMIEQNASPLADEYVMTIEEAAKERRSSLQVWVDGAKMPDSEIKFYPTRSNVDVFIPHKYLSPLSSHEVIVEKKMYDQFPYIHLYYQATSNQTFRLMLDADQLKALNEIKGSIEKNFQVYVNRKLYNSSRRLSYYNNSIEITLNVELTNSELEIICDPYTTFYFPSQSVRYQDEKNVYEIPETYIDSIHGPISRFSCAFFTNGLRVMNTKMGQKGRLHFEYDSESYANNALAFYLSDRNLVIDTNRILYGSDYSMYNFIGTAAVTRALHTTVSGNRFIDEGAGKVFDISVVKSLGNSSVKVYLPENIDFNEDGHQKIRLGFYTTRDVGNGKFYIDSNLTEVSPEDFTVDNTVNPVEITITAPSAYMADGTVTHGKLYVTSWYTWDEVLNNDATLFERTTVEAILSKYESVYDNEVKIGEMLRNRPYLMRTFLENYGYKTYSDKIEYNGTDPFVYLGVPDTIDVSAGANYDITVNNKHIPIDKIRIIKKDVTDVFEIEGKNFVKGENIISIQVINNMPVEYFKYKPEEVQLLDGTPILQVTGFTHIGYREDNIIILEKCDDKSDPDIIYFLTDYNVGYKVFKDWKFAPYNEDNNEVNIIFDRVPEHEFIVYNKNFSQHISYVKPTIQSVTDVIIPLYMGNAKDPIPFIPRGKVYVYCGGDKYIEGADYFIKTPEDDPSVAGSYIVMKRIVLPGAKIDIYFSNYKTENIYKKIGYFWNNKYGLFYLNDLKYPASLKYLNIYVNQQKLTEKDVDILSDKLIRVHSMIVPMYDLVVESAFTEDSWELQPYIQEYEPDNFEKYLARLFIGANPNANASDLEGAEDINEVYKSFVDTVDSVNKRPNPTARDDEWCPPGIGPHDEGNVTDGKDINTSVLVGDMYVVGADMGKVASCALDNVACAWTPCYADDPRFDGACYCDGKETNNEDLMSSILYHGYIIFGSRNGNLYAFGTTTNTWFNKDTLPLLNIDKTWPRECSINGFIFDQESDSLIMYGDGGNVDRFNWKKQKWAGVYDDPNKTTEDSIASSGVMGNIYTAFIIRKNPYNLLVVVGEKGKAASCYVNCDVPNAWIKGNGTVDASGGKIAPTIYSNGEYRNFSTVRSHCEYFGYKVLVGDDGIVTFFNYPNFVNTDVINICDMEGKNSLKHHMNDVIAFDERMMVLGGQDGKISHYEGEKMKWHDCDSTLGITSDGTIMQHNTINTMQLSSGKTHYIIFAGDNGIVCSYNIKVHEQPYRYDPWKSRFLVWYTTPGNAEIIATWDIPPHIARMFDMLRESNVGSEDIILRHGDDDLMVDVSMMDEDAYPWTEERINRFMAHFIQDLPEGDYSIDQIYDFYMKSKARYMLYERDLPLLACGNPVDTEEDLLITRKVDE